MFPRRALLSAIGAVIIASSAVALDATAQTDRSARRANWNRPQEPLQIFGNTYYVGPRGLSSVLITSDRGHVLIDGALPESAALIAANIRKLGFRVEDIQLIVNSHTHSDHAGGIAELQAMSGASVAASEIAAATLRRGRGLADDPQYEFGDSIPPVEHVRTVRDGEELHVGPTTLTVHYTPGHTPGGTSWTWRSCEGTRCLNMVYADSLNAVSDNSFRFSGDSRNPGIFEHFTRSLKVVAALPCDILIVPHPEQADLFAKFERRSAGEANAFIDRNACRNYSDTARRVFEERVAKESAERQ